MIVVTIKRAHGRTSTLSGLTDRDIRLKLSAFVTRHKLSVNRKYLANDILAGHRVCVADYTFSGSIA